MEFEPDTELRTGVSASRATSFCTEFEPDTETTNHNQPQPNKIMHDIDSTRLEASPDYHESQDFQEFAGDAGAQGEETFEMPMTEAEEEALAAELLGVSSEDEMDQFLGGLFRKLKRHLGGAAKFLAQNAGPLAGALKGIAAKALPSLGGALGTLIPIPGVGTALGAALGKAASNLLQSEMDNLEGEDQEFGMARRYVRLASQAIRQAARIRGRGNPSAVVNFALRNAFRRLRGRGGFWPRPVYLRYRPYAPCPPPEPCPTCPTCSQALPAADSPPADGSHEPAGAQPGPNTAAGAGASAEFGFEDAREFDGASELDGASEFNGAGEFGDAGQGEGEFYETDNEAPNDEAFTFPVPTGRRGGRWIRRGRKIILYGL